MRLRQSLKSAFVSTHFALAAEEASEAGSHVTFYYLPYYAVLHAVWGVLYLHPDEKTAAIAEPTHSKLPNVFRSGFCGPKGILRYQIKDVMEDLRLRRKYYPYRMPLNSPFDDEHDAMGYAWAISAHVGRWDECDRLIEEAYAAAGKLGILINNAGMSPRAPSHEVTEKLFDSVLNLNFEGPFQIASQVAKRMYDGDGGCTINVTSSGSMMPLPQVVPYGSSKAALNAMGRSLAWEYAPKVRVNTLSPGAFRTNIVEAWPDKGQGPIPIPRGHAADPQDIVTAALFLASPASVNVTGSIVRCDGGQH